MTSIVVFAGGVGGSRFVLGLRAFARERWPDGAGGTTAGITVIANTGDDAWLAGLRITPDLDSLTYALAGVADDERGWGRRGESERVSAELDAYGVGWPWFTLGDLDLGTHIARTAWLRDGLRLSEVVERLSRRWTLGVRLLPATDDEVETRVVLGDEGDIHFQEWWVRHRAAIAPRRFVQVGAESARPAVGVLEAISSADVILLAPSNPVVSLGTMLGFAGDTGAVPGIPGIRDAVRAARAPVVGVSPVIGGRIVRGMADVCLDVVGARTDAHDIARRYGHRSSGGVLDGWLVDRVDADDATPAVPTRAVPLWMRDPQTSAALAEDAWGLAAALVADR